MIDVLALLLMIVCVSAALCGHPAQPFPPARWWRAARAWRHRNRAWRAVCSPAGCRRPRRPPRWATGAGPLSFVRRDRRRKP